MQRVMMRFEDVRRSTSKVAIISNTLGGIIPLSIILIIVDLTVEILF